MRNRKQFVRLSKKWLITIVSMTMTMSSVFSAVSISAYAQDLGDNPEGNVIKVLAAEDTVRTNFGTIEINNGTIECNVSIVTENNKTITDNYGSVTDTDGNGNVGTNHANGIVAGANTVDNNYGNVQNASTVATNYASGTVTGSDTHVTDNFGTAIDVGNVENNYGTAIDSNVENNYSSGSVSEDQKDNVVVENNYGGNIAEGVEVDNSGASDAGPNVDKKNAVDPAPKAPQSPKRQKSVDDSSKHDDEPAPSKPNNVKVPDGCDELRVQLSNAIAAAKSTGKPQTVYWSKSSSLPADVMRMLQGSNVTLVFSCKYQGVPITLIIPGSAVIISPAVEWYGPVYLYALYGNNKQSTTTTTATVAMAPVNATDKATAKSDLEGIQAQYSKLYGDNLSVVDLMRERVTNSRADYSFQSINEELINAQLSSDGGSVVFSSGTSVSTTALAYADTASVNSAYMNDASKANVYLTQVNNRLSNGSTLDQACAAAQESVEKLNSDLSKDIPQNIDEKAKTAYVEAYVETYRQSIGENKPYAEARKAASGAANTSMSLPEAVEFNPGSSLFPFNQTYGKGTFVEQGIDANANTNGTTTFNNDFTLGANHTLTVNGRLID